jgi:hypothetical protein
MKSTFLANTPQCPKENWMVEGFQAFPACPDNGTIKINISMEQWWNKTN